MTLSLERFVAIDNVCAWPQLTRLTNGQVAAVLFNQPSHGMCEGEVDCWVSDDEGRRWSKVGVPVVHEPGTNRMNHASGLAGNGDLIVIVSGYDKRLPAGQESGFSGTQILDSIVSRSSDQGTNWQVTSTITPRQQGLRCVPFGPIIKRADGSLLSACYESLPVAAGEKLKSNATVYKSIDDGRAWHFHTVVAFGDYNKIAIHSVNDTRMLAAVRTYQNQTMHLYISDDAGDSWRFSEQVTGAYEHNAHLLNLPDGRILMTYGIRHPHHLGLACRVSTDLGDSWRRPHMLLNIDDVERYDAGYPSSVLVGDDRVLTAYYTRRSSWHQRYHMGTCLWNWRQEFSHGFDK